MGTLKGIDSNIIVYSINKDLPEHRPCKRFLVNVAKGEEVVSIPTIVFMESYHALVYVYKFSPKKVIQRLSAIVDSSYVNVLSISTGTIYLAFEIARSFQTGGRDSLIAASLLEHSIDEIYSHDKDFDEIERIKRIDPIDQI